MLHGLDQRTASIYATVQEGLAQVEDKLRSLAETEISPVQPLLQYVTDAGDSVTNTKKSGGGDLFVQLDKNKDGFLTKDEFTRPALFPFFDSDKDGRVTRKEGVEGMAKLKKREDDLRRGQEALRGLLEQFR